MVISQGFVQSDRLHQLNRSAGELGSFCQRLDIAREYLPVELPRHQRWWIRRCRPADELPRRAFEDRCDTHVRSGRVTTNLHLRWAD